MKKPLIIFLLSILSVVANAQILTAPSMNLQLLVNGQDPDEDSGKCETYEEDCERGQDEDGDGRPDDGPQNPDNPDDVIP